MMRRCLVLCLLCVTLFGADAGLRERAVAIPIGNPVEVRMAPDGKVRWKGQLVSVGAEGVTIRTVEGGAVKEKAIGFGEMQSIKSKRDTHTATKVLAGVGIAFVGLLIIGLALGS